jgi:hypothetical protein
MEEELRVGRVLMLVLKDEEVDSGLPKGED